MYLFILIHALLLKLKPTERSYFFTRISGKNLSCWVFYIWFDGLFPHISFTKIPNSSHLKSQITFWDSNLFAFCWYFKCSTQEEIGISPRGIAFEDFEFLQTRIHRILAKKQALNIQKKKRKETGPYEYAAWLNLCVFTTSHMPLIPNLLTFLIQSSRCYRHVPCLNY